MSTFDTIAKKITDRLLTTHFGDVGTRLAIMKEVPHATIATTAEYMLGKSTNRETYLGGWCREAIEREVGDVLREVLR